MKKVFLLAKNEQRVIAVVMLVLVTAALANHYRNNPPGQATRSTSTHSSMAPSHSPAQEDEAERDDAP